MKRRSDAVDKYVKQYLSKKALMLIESRTAMSRDDISQFIRVRLVNQGIIEITDCPLIKRAVYVKIIDLIRMSNIRPIQEKLLKKDGSGEIADVYPAWFNGKMTSKGGDVAETTYYYEVKPDMEYKDNKINEDNVREAVELVKEAFKNDYDHGFRKSEITRLFLMGYSQEEIGNMFNLGRSRVCQIISEIEKYFDNAYRRSAC